MSIISVPDILTTIGVLINFPLIFDNDMVAASTPLFGKPIAFVKDCSDLSLTMRGLGLPYLASAVTVPPVI